MEKNANDVFAVFREENNFEISLFLQRKEFISVSFAIENIIGNKRIMDLWKAWDEEMHFRIPLSVIVSPSEFDDLYTVMQIHRMPDSELNPPEPYHFAMYNDEGIARFKIPLSSGLLHYNEKTYYVSYLQKNRYRLEFL